MKLWDFALDFYRRDGVATACLALQDQAGVDVNVLIYLLWRIAVREESLPTSAVTDADRSVAAWRHDIVVPLRGLRRRLKTGPAPAPDAQTEALRGRLKAAEIEAEHIELDLLETLAGDISQSTTFDMEGEALEALQHLVHHYSGGSKPDVQEAVAALLRALR